jgi:hypothetical protein
MNFSSYQPKKRTITARHLSAKLANVEELEKARQ